MVLKLRNLLRYKWRSKNIRQPIFCQNISINCLLQLFGRRQFFIVMNHTFFLTLVFICSWCIVIMPSFANGQTLSDSAQADLFYAKANNIYHKQPDSAIYYLKKTVQLAEKIQDDEKVILSYIVMTNIFLHFDRYDSAEYYAVISIENVKTRYDTLHQYYFLGKYVYSRIFYSKGAYEATIDSYKDLLERILVLPDSLQKQLYLRTCHSASYNQIAICYDHLGDFEESERYWEQLLRFYERDTLASIRNIAIAHSAYASSFISQHRYRDGQRELLECLTILDTLDEQQVARDYVDAYFKMAKCYTELGEKDSAALMLNKADALQSPTHPRRPQVGLMRRGELALSNQHYKAALSFFTQCKDKWVEVYLGKIKHQNFVKVFTQIGETYAALHDFPQALHQYQKALAANHETMTGDEPPTYFSPISELRYSISSISVFNQKAKAFIDRAGGTSADRLLAQECFLRIDSLFGRALREFRSAESGAFFSKEFRPIYEQAIDNCYVLYQQTGDEKYLAEAFAYSERSKAILLSLALRDSKARIEGGLPEALLTQEHQLRTNISAYRQRIFTAKSTVDSTLLEAWRTTLFDLEEEFRSLEEEMEQNYPNYYQVKYGLKTVTPAQVQASLQGANHQLMALFLGDTTLYRFVLAKNKVQLFKQPFAKTAKAHFSALLNRLHNPATDDLSAFQEHGYGLYHSLFPYSFGGQLPTHLTIIPDGQLGFLPFGVLLTNEVPSETGFRELPYLLKSTQISYGYSATLLSTSFTRRAASFDQKLSAFAPSYQGALALTTSQPQAQAIVNQLGGEAYLANAATEATFNEVAARSRILHLAMHGVPDLEHPLYAHLLFGESGEEIDGKLYASELYNLSLKTQLVTLSACETGYGQLAPGEGVMSLARAFRYAGCQSVLFSHWKVDGRSASDLLTGFYEGIKEGDRPSEAIWQAKKSFLATAPPDQVHPHFWANFVLTGEDKSITSPKSAATWLLGGGLLLLLMALGFFFIQKRKRN